MAPRKCALLKQIPVVVQGSGDAFVASFVDANINASGCTETDAVDHLKDMLLARLEYLSGLPEKALGPALVKQLAVLREFIRR
jgi:hypothetical protein